MARTNRNQVMRIFTSGKYANDKYSLADKIGHDVKKAQAAVVRSVAGLSRRVPAMTKRLVLDTYRIASSKVSQGVRVRTTNAALSVDASALRFALGEFGGHWGGRSSPGATAEVVAGERRTYAGAFMAPGRLRGSVTSLIYSRTGRFAVMKSGRYAGKRREVIRANRGPSLQQMIVGHDQSGKQVGRDLRAALGEQMRDYYVGELHRQYELAGV